MGEDAFDGFRIAIDHGQQITRGTVGNTTALLPNMDGASIKAKRGRMTISEEAQATHASRKTIKVHAKALTDKGPRRWCYFNSLE